MSDDTAGLEVPFLRGADFYHPKHRVIFEAMQRVAGRGLPPDYLLVCAELERVGLIGDVGGDSYLARLLGVAPTTVHIAHYGRLVWRSAIYRRLISAAGRIAALGYENAPDAESVLVRAEAELRSVSESLYHRANPTDPSVLRLYEGSLQQQVRE